MSIAYASEGGIKSTRRAGGVYCQAKVCRFGVAESSQARNEAPTQASTARTSTINRTVIALESVRAFLGHTLMASMASQ